MNILTGICNLLNGAPWSGWPDIAKCDSCYRSGLLIGISTEADLPYYACDYCIDDWPERFRRKEHRSLGTITTDLGAATGNYVKVTGTTTSPVLIGDRNEKFP